MTLNGNTLSLVEVKLSLFSEHHNVIWQQTFTIPFHAIFVYTTSLAYHQAGLVPGDAVITSSNPRCPSKATDDRGVLEGVLSASHRMSPA